MDSQSRRSCRLHVAVLLAAAVACSGEGGGDGVAPDGATVPAPDEISAPLPPRPGEAEPLHLLGRRQRALPGKPEWVVAADLDGDGAQELLTTSLTPGGLHAWRGGEGGLARTRRDVAVGAYPLRPAIVPAAAPGRALVAVASRADSMLALLDPLAANPAEPVAREALSAVPRAMAAGDLGADGRVELAIATDGPRLVATDGRGWRSERVLDDELPCCILVPRDGGSVLVGFQSTRSLRRVPFAGGALGEPGPAISLGGIPRGMAEAELDGDATPELVVVGGDHSVWVFGFGAGSGRDRLADPPLEWSWPAGAVPIDVEVVPTGGDRDALLLLGAAGLTYGLWSDFTPDGPRVLSGGYAGQTPLDAALVDADGDGMLDAAIANRDSVAVSLIPRRDAARFHADTRTPAGGFPNGVAAGDVLADGRPDVVVLNSKDDDVSVLWNEGGALVPGTRVPVGPAPREPALADLDGDGALDLVLVVGDSAGTRLVRRLGDGRGGLEPRAEHADVAVGRAAAALLVGDADGDGALEMVVADPEADELVVFENGHGAVLTEELRVQVASGPNALALLELGNDPDPELAIALGGRGGGRRGVLIGKLVLERSGLRFEEIAHVEVEGVPFRIAAADLNGDGLDDLAVLANASDDANQGLVSALLQFRVDGRAHLVPWHTLPTSLAPRDLDAVDLDGDGLAELVVCAQYAHVLNLYRARGNGKQWKLERLDDLGAGVGCMAACAADVTGDGAPDLIVVNGHSDDVSVIPLAGR